MANYYCYLISAIVVFAVFIQIATPIRCYVCTTVEDGTNCTDPVKLNHTVAACDLPTSVCLKQILPVFGKYPQSIHRSCVDENYCKNYEKSSVHCSLCSVDLCNSSFTISPSYTVVTLFLSIYFICNTLIR